jgi:hypothetical protein
MALYGQDTNRFITMVQTDMANMQALLAPADGLMLVGHALGVEQGPCAFITLGPSLFSNNPIIEVIHCIRQYMPPASTPNAAADPLQHRSLVFAGEMAHGQLPKVWLEPTTGLPAHFQEAVIAVPTYQALDVFYQNHAVEQLAPNRMVTTNKNVRYMTYIPQVWVPALIGGKSPKEALDCVRELIHMMPVAEHGKVEYINDYRKAACQQLGGNSAQRDASKMVVPFANPGRTPALQGWELRQLTTFYPHLGGGPMRAPGQAQPAIDFTAFGNNLAWGLTAGMTTAAQGFAALLPLPAAKTKDDWTPLQKRMIVKLIGKGEDADFEAVAPEFGPSL